MSETGPHDPQNRDQLMREAASWFARMRAPDAEDSRDAFEAWLARGALHRAAYNRASEIFSMGKLLRKPAIGPAPRRRRIVVLAGMSALLLPLLGWIALPAGNDPAVSRSAAVWSRQLLSSEGSRLAARLADGSLVELGPSSLVDIRMSADHRRIFLRRGAARFRVAHEARPFEVNAGGGSIVARGTLFDVSLTNGHRVVVRLHEGAVDVTAPPGGATRMRRLAPGDAVRFVATDPGERAEDFADIRLAALIDEANGGSSRPIRLEGAGLGDLRVSGRFRIDDTVRLARRLAALFGLEADLTDPAEIVLRRR